MFVDRARRAAWTPDGGQTVAAHPSVVVVAQSRGLAAPLSLCVPHLWASSLSIFASVSSFSGAASENETSTPFFSLDHAISDKLYLIGLCYRVRMNGSPRLRVPGEISGALAAARDHGGDTQASRARVPVKCAVQCGQTAALSLYPERRAPERRRRAAWEHEL